MPVTPNHRPHRPEDQNALRDVLANWDIPDIERIVDLYENRVFRVQVADGATYVLKNTKPLWEAQRWEFILDVLAHVQRRGVNVPRYLRNKAGEAATGSNGGVYVLAEFIGAGAVPNLPDDKEVLFQKAGQALAHLHTALGSYPCDQLAEETWSDRELLKTNRYLVGPDLEKVAGPRAAEVKRIADQREKDLVATLWGLPEQLIHRDCHLGNIILDGATVIGFIDCDHLCLGWPMTDLASFIAEVPWVNDEYEDTMDRTLALLQGYRGIRELAPADLAALPYLILDKHWGSASWYIERGETRLAERHVDAMCWMHANFDQVSRNLVA